MIYYALTNKTVISHSYSAQNKQRMTLVKKHTKDQDSGMTVFKKYPAIVNHTIYSNSDVM